MQILLKDVGKRFERQWVFRRLSFDLPSGTHMAILGPNGSGKSTLLKIIAGWLNPTEGTITYTLNGLPLDESAELFGYLTMAAPYLELIEEFTLAEAIEFHFRFKKPMPGLTLSDITRASGLEDKSHRPIRYFSSGMKQRVKLVLALLSDTPLVLLDEPCSNLDAAAKQWYRKLIDEFTQGRTVVVGSNHSAEEYDFCTEIVLLNSSV
ncbi:MAG: ABC transporter ATP-binding protein [Bacteroidales bacterium]